MSRKIIILSALAISALASYSCEGIGGGNASSESYYLELVNEADTLLVFNADFEDTYDLPLNTNIPKKDLKVTPVEEQQWCGAKVSEDGGAITFLPAEEGTENREATFLIEAVSGVDVKPLTIVVRKLYEVIAPSVTVKKDGVTLEGESLMVNVSGSEQTISFTVEITEGLWKLDYEVYSDDDYVVVDKKAGRSGETVKITLKKNESGTNRNPIFTFSPSIVGTDVAVTVSITQAAWSSIEQVVVKEFNVSSMTSGAVLENGHVVSFPNSANSQTPFCFSVDIQGKGGINVKFAEPGSSELGNSDWAFFGRKEIQNEDYETIGYYYTLTTTFNKPYDESDAAPGSVFEPRSVDAVMIAEGAGLELFRFRIEQAGWSAQ